jgi:hypothetical protein
MAKKTRKAKKAKKAKKAAAKRSSQKRDLIKGRAKGYAKRTESGQFKEIDTMSRSQRTDRKRKAKKKAKSGFGDRGDR